MSQLIWRDDMGTWKDIVACERVVSVVTEKDWVQCEVNTKMINCSLQDVALIERVIPMPPLEGNPRVKIRGTARVRFMKPNAVYHVVVKKSALAEMIAAMGGEQAAEAVLKQYVVANGFNALQWRDSVDGQVRRFSFGAGPMGL